MEKGEVIRKEKTPQIYQECQKISAFGGFRCMDSQPGPFESQLDSLPKKIMEEIQMVWHRSRPIIVWQSF
ncbi:hypothetical protein BBR01nite_35870 [Brevibacillus brevis]|nr:hypothetical protein BBR01nite_35870 [Brevibacillus brevis]